MTHITFMPAGTQVQASQGETVLAVAHRAGVWIASSCGGQGMCTSCRVVVQLDAQSVTAPGRCEIKQLGEAQLTQGMRLACQARLTSGELVVTLRG